ncbi:MAG: dihydropteroate synthase [Planctomycetia bacterium]|nr:dihydropteroate synthase [Planctomycetia bacterium]
MNPFCIQTHKRRIRSAEPIWMAIINVTPDSFSDGGRANPAEHALKLWSQGAQILDIGGESTRPGSSPISADEEIARVEPVLKEIFRHMDASSVPAPLVSIDTYHPETARFALDHGVEMINDISGAEDPEMVQLLQKTGAAVCFMHMKGRPATMQEAPQYNNVVEEVYDYLASRRDALLEVGIARESLVADPGLGFGKTFDHNLILVENIERLHALGVPILVGHSRKGFLSRIHPDRKVATQIVSDTLVKKGVQILRTHADFRTQVALP